MLASLGFFAIGSAICGAAPSMTVMLVGRSIQGIGGGGILSLAEIIVTDLVPMVERGLYYGVGSFIPGAVT
jgi:MFS family permease